VEQPSRGVQGRVEEHPSQEGPQHLGEGSLTDPPAQILPRGDGRFRRADHLVRREHVPQRQRGQRQAVAGATEQEACRPGRGPASVPWRGQAGPAARRHGQHPAQERPQPQRAHVHLPTQLGIAGQHHLEPAVQEKAIPAVGADPAAYLVTGFADDDGQAGPVQVNGCAQPG
jgi:hypothetical protein